MPEICPSMLEDKMKLGVIGRQNNRTEDATVISFGKELLSMKIPDWVNIPPRLAATQVKISTQFKLLFSQHEIPADCINWDDFQTRVRCWHLNLIALVVNAQAYIPESESDEFWVTLAIAFVGGKEKEISKKLPHIERYSQPNHLASEGYVDGKGPKLLVKDIFDVNSISYTEDMSEKMLGLIALSDRYLIFRTAEEFGDSGLSNFLRKEYNF